MRRSTSQHGPPPKKIVLIQCEGSDTEYNYFLGLRGHCGRDTPYRLVPKRGEGGDAERVVSLAVKEISNAKKRGEAYDCRWCVLDVEGTGSAAKLAEAVNLAQKHKINLCLSNPSFEVWLIAHFENTSRHFADGEAASQYLERAHWRPQFHMDYDKADPDLYRKLASRLPDALANAKQVLENHPGGNECREANASTEVYKLIQRLLPPG